MRRQEAWGFIEAHDDELRGFARRRVSATIIEADDTLHDAYIATVERAEQIDASRNLKSYIMGAVVNRNIDEIRKLNRRGNYELDEDIHAAPGSVEDQAITNVMVEGVLHDIGRLPPDQRECIQMRAIGFTQAEIAEHQGAPLGTVKSRQNRAITRLTPPTP